MRGRPKVSIVTISYNQEKYIQEALESFVTQETDFAFEVIVADDGSTDKTQEIITSYAARYPDIFRPILRDKNIGIHKNISDALSRARGEYIALCEGDDYWTDTTKLQRQADFLDKHPSYSLCFHPVRVFFQNKEEEDSIYPEQGHGYRFTIEELLRWNFIQTNSVMYRKRDYKNLPQDVLPLDWYLHLYHAQYGKIGYIDRVMGAYRRHASGIWWASHSNADELWRKHAMQYLSTYQAISSMYGKNEKYRTIISNGAADILRNTVDVESRYHDGLLLKIVSTFPDEIVAFILSQQKKIKDTEEYADGVSGGLHGKEEEVAHLNKMLGQKDQEAREYLKELDALKSSKIWVVRNRVARLIGKKVI